jgi:hypothetical protein
MSSALDRMWVMRLDCLQLCRFVGRPSGDAGVSGRGRQVSDKRQGTKSRRVRQPR